MAYLVAFKTNLFINMVTVTLNSKTISFHNIIFIFIVRWLPNSSAQSDITSLESFIHPFIYHCIDMYLFNPPPLDLFVYYNILNYSTCSINSIINLYYLKNPSMKTLIITIIHLIIIQSQRTLQQTYSITATRSQQLTQSCSNTNKQNIYNKYGLASPIKYE